MLKYVKFEEVKDKSRSEWTRNLSTSGWASASFTWIPSRSFHSLNQVRPFLECLILLSKKKQGLRRYLRFCHYQILGRFVLVNVSLTNAVQPGLLLSALHPTQPCLYTELCMPAVRANKGEINPCVFLCKETTAVSFVNGPQGVLRMTWLTQQQELERS